MRQEKETTIGATRYKIKQLGAVTGGELVFRLGLPLISLIGAASLNQETIRILTKSLNVEDFKWAVAQFNEATSVYIVDTKGAPDPKTGSPRGNWFPLASIYDDHFAGDYGAWFQWLKFAAEVNFGDFFGGSAGAPQSAATASSVSPFPTDATGSSGA